MAGLCTASVSPSNCAHRTLTIQWDGQGYTLEHVDVDQPLTVEERQQYLGLAVRLLKSKGVSLAQFLNRVLVGEEATNVKQYTFLGPGSAITKTNIGTAYVNINVGANGERVWVDLTGCTEMLFVASVNVPVGTVGPLGLRCVRDSDSVVLFENAAITATPTGERELDTGWVPIPGAFLPGGFVLLRVQGKSGTAADDPIIRRVALFTR